MNRENHPRIEAQAAIIVSINERKYLMSAGSTGVTSKYPVTVPEAFLYLDSLTTQPPCLRAFLLLHDGKELIPNAPATENPLGSLAALP